MSELPCPEMTGALDVAEKLLARFGHLHSDPASVQGMITLQRALTEELHAVLPCRPSITERGQLVCSLAAVINAVSSLLLASSLQANSAVQLDAVAKGQTAERETGMYI